MKIRYVSEVDIEAHRDAMQRVVEDEKKEQEEINDKKKRTIEYADKKMRKAIEAAQKEVERAVEAAKKEADDISMAASDIAERRSALVRVNKREKLAAMWRDFKRLPLLRQVYHEAPDDVFELILSKCYDLDEIGWGKGGLNSFRLANKRLKQVVESCTTRLTGQQEEDGPDSLPIPIIQRCRSINAIRCESHNLRSLEGCPDGLKRLFIGHAPHLSDLSPLASCSTMKMLWISDSSVTDIALVASMPLLEVFACQKRVDERPSIKHLSLLFSCPRLKRLFLGGNHVVKDLSPLSSCKDLEVLEIIRCPLITSLASLSTLKKLKTVYCGGIAPTASLLPLASCAELKVLKCHPDAVDLDELRRRMTSLIINPAAVI